MKSKWKITMCSIILSILFVLFAMLPYTAFAEEQSISNNAATTSQSVSVKSIIRIVGGAVILVGCGIGAVIALKPRKKKDAHPQEKTSAKQKPTSIVQNDELNVEQ